MNIPELSSSDTPIISNEDIFNLHDLPSASQQISQGRYDQINELFENQSTQDRAVKETREVLGDTANDLSDSQVYDLSCEIQFLVDSWLEEFEKNIFEGKTLDELIGLKT